MFNPFESPGCTSVGPVPPLSEAFEAVQERRNDLDGRGHLSEEALARFARFFLSTCIDQVEFMEERAGFEPTVSLPLSL